MSPPQGWADAQALLPHDGQAAPAYKATHVELLDVDGAVVDRVEVGAELLDVDGADGRVLSFSIAVEAAHALRFLDPSGAILGIVPTATGKASKAIKRLAARTATLRAVQEMRRLELHLRMIGRLLPSLREVVGMQAMLATWPAIGDERETLSKIQKLAPILADALDSLSPRTTSHVREPIHDHFGIEFASLDRLANVLRVLAYGCRDGKSALPDQAQRTSQQDIVARVHAITRPLNWPVPVSDDRKSLFYRACKQAFVIAGAGHLNPAGAIRAYKETLPKVAPPTPTSAPPSAPEIDRIDWLLHGQRTEPG